MLPRRVHCFLQILVTLVLLILYNKIRWSRQATRLGLDADDRQRPCDGRLAKILSDAGIQLTLEICQQLPDWHSVVDLYGSQPVIVGLETVCSSRGNSNSSPMPRLGGLYNTGTHLMQTALNNSLIPWEEHPMNMDRQCNWKHSSLPRREALDKLGVCGDYFNNNASVAIIMVRDPFQWMQSMCRNSYDLEWWKYSHNSSSASSCPLSVTVSKTYSAGATPPVTETYKSLADMWTTWNRAYTHSVLIPTLMVRFEDLLFHAPAVMKAVTDCLGLPSQPFVYPTARIKNNSYSSDFLQALVNYGTEEGRYDMLTEDDLRIAQSALDPRLLKLFQYKAVPNGLNGK